MYVKVTIPARFADPVMAAAGHLRALHRLRQASAPTSLKGRGWA
jgi:hypothetical protein